MYYKMIKLAIFKLLVHLFYFLLKRKTVIVALLVGFIGTISFLYFIFSANILGMYVAYLIASLGYLISLMKLSHRILHKKLTDFVLVNRVSGSISMALMIDPCKVLSYRKQLPEIISVFAKEGVPKLSKLWIPKQFHLKTHDFILRELQKQLTTVKVSPIQSSILMERAMVSTFKQIFNKRYFRKYFSKKIQIYKVIIPLGPVHTPIIEIQLKGGTHG